MSDRRLELSALLAGIDISALTGSDAVEVTARACRLSHEQARLLGEVGGW
ncbi:MAG TPA: hypothetical protein VJ757_01250 [Pseudonocardiaceae bacterium]|nr:hypothetical protein [Pseudonocardiaceae bacterium]